MNANEFDHYTDVVIVGSGVAASVTALAAAEGGLNPLLLESTDKYGGNSAISGGGLWVPNNHVMKRAGQTDSYEEARTYMDDVIGDVGPASSPERRHAFITEGPQMVRFLEDLGFQWVFGKGYSDYYPERPGGKPIGRGVEGQRFDLRRLGPLRDLLRAGGSPLPILTPEVSQISVALRTPRGFLTGANVVGVQAIGKRLLGQHLVAAGNSLMGQLLMLVGERRIPIWMNAAMTDLIMDGDRVAGVRVERGGRTLRVGARYGVMIAAGGFEKNATMRQKYQEAPIGSDWTSGTPGNLGVPLQAAVDVGAATALMDDAWWGPTVLWPGDVPGFMLSERSLPFGFIVDSSGERFFNESESYIDAGHHIYERNRDVSAIPAFHIFDSHHRRYYPYGLNLPGQGTGKMVDAGFMTRADTLEQLAQAIGVDPHGLTRTADRFAEFARTGKDLDFHRGDSAYDRVYSDSRVKPNPNLGAPSRPPFYAVKVWPGDLGTKGGVLTDEYSRALREDGSPITGLYAAGNSSASVMGHTYPGPGSTIGPAATFGYIAGTHLAHEAQNAWR